MFFDKRISRYESRAEAFESVGKILSEGDWRDAS